jgi:hypothetical protein
MMLAPRPFNIRSWVSVTWIPRWHARHTRMQASLVRHGTPNRHDSDEEVREPALKLLIEPGN